MFVTESNLKTDSYSPTIEIPSKDYTLNFLLDTGASTSCINENVFNNEENLTIPLEIITAGGNITIRKSATAPIFYPFNKTQISFIVSPFKLPFTGIIGIDVMQK